MRSFAISDIHGNIELFRAALNQIDLRKEDKLFLLGDLIDRGTDSKGVLDTVMELIESGYDVVCLMGNHEQMLLDASQSFSYLSRWILNGGDTTLASFGIISIKKIPEKYLRFIGSFKYFIENEHFVFAHAAVNMKIEDPLLDIDTILWERDPERYLNNNWLGERKLIHGHTPTSRGEILSTIEAGEQIICIDNGSFVNRKNYGSLCVLHLESLQVHFCWNKGKKFTPHE